MKAIRTTTSKFGVVWGGLTNEEKMKLMTLCEEKAAKEQKSAKVYSKYVHDMDTDGSMAVVPDDKTKHAHWMYV